MASLTIRKLDERVKQQLRVRAAEHGNSMEEEARAILRDALVGDAAPSKKHIYDVIREIVEEHGGFDDLVAKIPPRRSRRHPLRFED